MTWAEGVSLWGTLAGYLGNAAKYCAERAGLQFHFTLGRIRPMTGGVVQRAQPAMPATEYCSATCRDCGLDRFTYHRSRHSEIPNRRCMICAGSRWIILPKVTA